MICMCLFVYISQVWNLPNPSGNMILGWKPCLRTSIQARTLHCVQGYWALLPYKPRDMDTSPTWETQWRIACDILDHEMVRNVCLLGHAVYQTWDFMSKPRPWNHWSNRWCSGLWRCQFVICVELGTASTLGRFKQQVLKERMIAASKINSNLDCKCECMNHFAILLVNLQGNCRSSHVLLWCDLWNR